jgi:hypothetical protein
MPFDHFGRIARLYNWVAKSSLDELLLNLIRIIFCLMLAEGRDDWRRICVIGFEKQLSPISLLVCYDMPPKKNC